MASSASETFDPKSEENRYGGIILIAVLGLVLLGFCTRTVVMGHRQAARIASAVQCSDGRTRDCFARTRGVVESADDDDVVIRYDDERRTVGLGSVGYVQPERGTKVLLESWNGRFVSALDPLTEHRYRGSHWPKAANGGAIVGMVLAVASFVTMGWMWLKDVLTRRRGRPGT
jgi:hypothetical protein